MKDSSKTERYTETMREGQRRMNDAVAPLADKMKQDYELVKFNEIKVGDKITIAGMNIAPDGKMYFDKPGKKERRRLPLSKLTVVEVLK